MSVMDTVAASIAEVAKHHHGGEIHPHPPHPRPHPHYVEHVTAAGVRTLTLVTIIMAVAFCVFVGSAIGRKGSDRAHAFLGFFICGMAALSYFAMSTQEGAIDIHVHGGYRQVFYARYIDCEYSWPSFVTPRDCPFGLRFPCPVQPRSFCRLLCVPVRRAWHPGAIVGRTSWSMLEQSRTRWTAETDAARASHLMVLPLDVMLFCSTSN